MIKPTPQSFPLRTVDIIIYPGFKALEAIGAMKVFDYANTHLHLRNLPGARQGFAGMQTHQRIGFHRTDGGGRDAHVITTR